MISAKDDIVKLDLTLHAEEADLVLGLGLGEPIQALRRLLDDQLQDVGRADRGALVLRDVGRGDTHGTRLVERLVIGEDVLGDRVHLVFESLQRSRAPHA